MNNFTRDTTTGLDFEKKVIINDVGIDLSKYNLYSYLKKQNIDYKSIISRKLLPDEAYFDDVNKIFHIYEKKYQCNEGSADEKLQTCAFKISQFRKIGRVIGAEKVTYTYVLNDWFKQDKYRDVLDYIRTVDGCDYIFEEEIDASK